MPAEATEVTRLLHDWENGDESARDDLLRAVYDDLRAIAARRLGRGNVDVTYRPTVLVHEAYLRLLKQRETPANREQFFAIVTRLMIRVLLDHHRACAREKRGGGWVRVDLEDAAANAAAEESSFPDLVEALERLEKLAPRKAEVVKLHVFWGLTHPAIADLLGIGRATVERDWQFARAWLRKELPTD